MILPKKVVIEINKGILTEWLEENPKSFEKISVNEEELTKILNDAEKQESEILQASYLMAAISWAQPFGGGNKRTAFVCADTFLRMNGFKLEVKDTKDIDYLIKLLFEIQEERAQLNPEGMAKIVLYVSKRIVKI